MYTITAKLLLFLVFSNVISKSYNTMNVKKMSTCFAFQLPPTNKLNSYTKKYKRGMFKTFCHIYFTNILYIFFFFPFIFFINPFFFEMPLFTIANLSLFSGQEDQIIKVSNDLWKSLVPTNYTKGKCLKDNG